MMKRNFLSKLFQASLVCCLAVILTGCEELLSALDNPIQTSLNMATTDVKLGVGEQKQRQATCASPATVVYASADPAIATVDAKGIVTGVAAGTTTITASVAAVDGWTAASASYKVIVSAKTPATITTPPTATASIEPNSETALVIAGVADGGELMYAVTTTNTKPTTTEGFSATIPTAAALAAGTYYVWYYAKGDATHSDSEIAATAIEVKVGNSGLLAGKFSVSATKQVQFSQGNLQATYDGTKWTWAFAEHQWDYIGDTSCNQKVTTTTPFVSENGTVDLFRWVGASSTWTDVNQYGISSSKTFADYGTGMGENLKVDWGATIGTDWRTLNSDEWIYMLKTRTVNGGTGSGHSYTIGQSVNGKLGLVIYPDDYTGATYTTASDWATFEAAGCVFLPAAGYHTGDNLDEVGNAGRYWTSTSPTSFSQYACFWKFNSSNMSTNLFTTRYCAYSVRLVSDVATE